jgi:DNA-binding NarL/FixJ family response regulator
MVKTLLVEDNATFRQVIKETLVMKFPSMSIDEAEDGKEAMEKVDRHSPDLILMDIKLPGENGLVLTEKIKKLSPHVVIIILTDYDLPEYREAAHQRGADHFLEKASTTANEIVELIESLFPSKVGA